VVLIRTDVPWGGASGRETRVVDADSPGELRVTPNVRQVLGLEPEEVSTIQSWMARIHPDDRDRASVRWRSGSDRSTVGARIRYRMRHGDGTYRWIESLGSVHEGEPRQIIAFVSDVTREHEEEERLRERERQLRTMFDGAPAQIYAKDLDGRLLLCNAELLHVWGMRSEQVIGRTDQELWPEFADEYRANDLLVAQSGTPTVADEEVILGGELRTYLSLKFPLRDDNGEIYATGGVSADISDRTNDLRELRIARDVAERANISKSEFLSRMSHELRTPLNSVLGFAQLLDLALTDDRHRENVAHILTAGRHLLELINEVLDIARIEAGRLPVTIEPVDLRASIRSAIDLVGPAAEAPSVTIAIGDDGGAALVAADPNRLLQVLLNLLTNAIKYNRPRGSITITTEARDAGTTRVCIADTGRGIREEHLDAVFEPFVRPGTDDGSIEGSGVGLALCKSLVELMGGSIGLESRWGHGTTVWFDLPTSAAPIEGDAAPDDGHDEDEAPVVPVTMQVLYIEDNEANRALVTHVLGLRPGVTLVCDEHGRRGLELAREQRPDLILLDLHLPDLPGADVLAELRSDDRLRSIPTYVLSADVTPRQRERLLDAGARGYLTKPLDVRSLLAVIDDHAPAE
jgi:PAS domain S-box-containing protein